MRCARCSRRIFRHSPVNANWCPNDEVFLCRKCLRELKAPADPGTVNPPGERGSRCPACGTPMRSVHPKLFALLLVLLIMSSIFFVTFGYSYFHDSAIASTPTVALGLETTGETVHVAGTIVAPVGQEVLWGHYVQAGKSSHWDYYGTSFTIVSGNNSLAVEAGNIQQIYSAPHATDGGNDIAFYEGDHVELIGSVSQVLGVLTLNAQYAAASPGDFLPAEEGLAALVTGLFLTFGVAAVLALEVVALRRSRTHAKNTTGPNAFAYRLPDGATLASPIGPPPTS